jgi:expansin (peptidoglycan-binding protein)
VTFYDLGGTAVNCSFDVVSQKPDVIAHVPFGGGQFFGAMNTTDYDSAGVCGACVEVTRKDSGKSVSLVIVDQCPSDSNPVCKSGHIDMSRAAFLQIGTEAEGYLGTTNGGATGQISWKYVACPAMENISFRLKEPSNQYWNQILVAGHRYPITRLEAFVGGSWQEGVRQSYNYWQVGDGNLGAPPYQVRVTDASGSVIEASLALVAGDQASSAQFPLCQ